MLLFIENINIVVLDQAKFFLFMFADRFEMKSVLVKFDDLFTVAYMLDFML